MERESRSFKKRLPELMLYAAGAYWLKQLVFSIPNGSKKEKSQYRADTPVELIWERAGGKCEHCGFKQEDGLFIVGHIFHDNPDYNHPDNLALHCIACETRHHLLHIEQPEKIGLGRKDNLSSTYGLLVRFYQHAPNKFRKFYHRHHETINGVFSHFNTHYAEFLQQKSAEAAANKPDSNGILGESLV